MDGLPISINDRRIAGLNSLIACEGNPELAYIRNCKRYEIQPQDWALCYIRLYLKYTRNHGLDKFIDVPMAKRALREALVEYTEKY